MLPALPNGYRFYKRDDMDLMAEPEAGYRSDVLRELVDLLPDDEREVISRMFFGGDRPGLAQLAKELGISIDKLKGRRDRALARLAGVLDGETLASLSA